MSIEIIWDDAERSQFEADLNAAADQVEQGFPDTMQKIGAILSASIDEQFLQSGVPKWPRLAWRTIEERKEWEVQTGQKVVAGIMTPLRRSDATRLASIAHVPGVAGSAFKSDARMVQVGPDDSVLDYVHEIFEGSDEKNIPERNPIELSEEKEEQAIAVAQDALDDFAASFGN